MSWVYRTSFTLGTNLLLSDQSSPCSRKPALGCGASRSWVRIGSELAQVGNLECLAENFKRWARETPLTQKTQSLGVRQRQKHHVLTAFSFWNFLSKTEDTFPGALDRLWQALLYDNGFLMISTLSSVGRGAFKRSLCHSSRSVESSLMAKFQRDHLIQVLKHLFNTPWTWSVLPNTSAPCPPLVWNKEPERMRSWRLHSWRSRGSDLDSSTSCLQSRAMN